MSQGASLIIKVNKTGKTPLASVLLIPSKLFPYIGRKKHIPYKSSYPQLLFYAEVGSLAACHSQECAQRRHYKPKEKGAKHLCRSI